MQTIIRFGLCVFCLFGIFVGASIFFESDLLLKLCGKSCGFNRALVVLFGADFAKLLLSMIWFFGAAVAGFLALRRSKD
ncbi:hypothetical protein [Acidovorax sp. Root217]|uniref:hypothetical protein n=1 Tax=Acidovorax sp. Root217 TaxID=1736492 RepID=UPI00138F75E8|nr:hypothetical protein [Acidovorax sp. Root217]